jgi:RHS repeat-associated protein
VLERLNAEAGGTATSFTYDGIGNRLTEVAGGTTTYTYPSSSSKLSSVGANSYTYDAMGNVTGDTARTYVWSAAGLLKDAKIGGSTVGTYTYDASNLRTKKVAGGTTTHYVHGLGGKLYGEYDNSGVLIREYVWLNGEPLAQIDKSGGTESVTYLHTDHLATPRYGTNAAGSTVWTWDSGAFGKEAPTGTATVNLRFPGQYFDSESTLHYNWNRYYNPAIGRYISSDPTGLKGGADLYIYVEVNPLLLMDPQGLSALFQSIAEAVVGAFSEAFGKPDVRRREYTGVIYAAACGPNYKTLYAYTIAEAGTLGGDIVVNPHEDVATWHTHTGREPQQRIPSPKDLVAVHASKIDMYIGLPSWRPFWNNAEIIVLHPDAKSIFDYKLFATLYR